MKYEYKFASDASTCDSSYDVNTSTSKQKLKTELTVTDNDGNRKTYDVITTAIAKKIDGNYPPFNKWDRKSSSIIIDKETNTSLYIDDTIMKIDGMILARMEDPTDEEIKGRVKLTSVSGYSALKWNGRFLPPVHSTAVNNEHKYICYKSSYKNDINVAVNIYEDEPSIGISSAPKKGHGYMRISAGSSSILHANVFFDYKENPLGPLCNPLITLNSFSSYTKKGKSSIRINKRNRSNLLRQYQVLEYGEASTIPMKIDGERRKFTMYKVEHLRKDNLFGTSIEDSLEIIRNELTSLFSNEGRETKLPEWITKYSDRFNNNNLIEDDDDIYITEMSDSSFDNKYTSNIIIEKAGLIRPSKRVVVKVTKSKDKVTYTILAIDIRYSNGDLFHYDYYCDDDIYRYTVFNGGNDITVYFYKDMFDDSIECITNRKIKNGKLISSSITINDTYETSVIPDIGNKKEYIDGFMKYWSDRRFGLHTGGFVREKACYEPTVIDKVFNSILMYPDEKLKALGLDMYSSDLNYTADIDEPSAIIHSRYREYMDMINRYITNNGIEFNTLNGMDLYEILFMAFSEFRDNEKFLYERFPRKEDSNERPFNEGILGS